MTELFVEYVTAFIAMAGYAGLVVLMAFESMILPVPSEAVMPFAGFLIFEGKFTFHEVTFFSTLGSIIGSEISYLAGSYGGRPFIRKFGKYLLLDMRHLELTERFFNKYGDKTIFASRFIPVIRHLISIPAGAGRMNPVKFTAYTVFGAGLWNTFLAYVGFHLKSHWMIVRKYGELVDLVVLGFLVAGVVYLIFRYKTRSKH